MGTRATVYQISTPAYEAAVAGDYEKFGNDDMGTPLHIEKAWHAIYYLLTGDNELLLFPSGVALEMMSEYSEVHSAKSTKIINNRLLTAVKDYDGKDLDVFSLNTNAIYPRDWQQESLDCVKLHLDALSEFVGNAVSRGNGLFVIIA